ncbi:hypothetical protein C0Q70_02457 [Pomacea canaliculata]|uniref:RING-type E3 ubiquitin transferase n=1 Tax=Pomacea canaliculata TaxID=400727 RepID=A0A2T7PPY9_POMCA|nr:hypothetical protein C0Q70_02457 [Pomacea canaliculata]
MLWRCVDCRTVPCVRHATHRTTTSSITDFHGWTRQAAVDVRDFNLSVKTPSSPPAATTTVFTGRSEALSIIGKDTKQTAQHPVNACQDFNAHAIVSSDEDNEEEEMSVKVGDSVAVAVGEDELVDLQKKLRRLHPENERSEVVRVSKGGSVYVNFIPMGQYRFNPKALVKVIQVREGQLVRIRPDKDQVKILNRRVGWKDEMTNTVGQVGRVIKLDEKGVVAISFGNSEFCYTYTKACCLPAHGAPQDSHNCGTSGRDTKLFPVSVVLLCGSEYIAKETGDRVTVSRLCRANRELLESAWNRMSPLMAACTYGHLKIVKLLLNLGANVSRIFGLYRSPLGAALEANRKEENICILLIERGADVRVVDGLDRSYMHIAATYDLPNVIGVLAARGADVNARDKHLDTPLHNAVQRKNHRAMEALLEVKGIDVRAKNRLDYTALHLASKDGCSRVVIKKRTKKVKKILALDANGVDDLHYKEETALHLAAMSGHADVIRLLVIDGKADINLRNDERLSQTPLHYTCAKANFKAAEALMELGADINHQDCRGNSPLHLAVSYWSKAEVDLQSESTRREYHARVAIGCMLISKGAYVDTKSKKGFDPFQFGLFELRESVKRFMKHNQHLVRCKDTSHAVDPDLFRLVSPSASPNKRESFLWVKCGVRHLGETCAVCGEKDVCGMLWRCRDCDDCCLCTQCYCEDKHDVDHEFLRVDTPGSSGTTVNSRSKSLKIQAVGIFPGAKVRKVMRYNNEEVYGSKGEVEGYETGVPYKCRNMLCVRWSDGILKNCCLGEIICTEEAAGPICYRDHLPLLDIKVPSVLADLSLACESELFLKDNSSQSVGTTCVTQSVSADVVPSSLHNETVTKAHDESSPADAHPSSDVHDVHLLPENVVTITVGYSNHTDDGDHYCCNTQPSTRINHVAGEDL